MRGQGRFVQTGCETLHLGGLRAQPLNERQVHCMLIACCMTSVMSFHAGIIE